METIVQANVSHTILQKLKGASVGVSYALFWFGVLWFGLGNVITFVPGAEREWFIAVAGLVAFGLIVPRCSYRIAAALLLLLSVLAAFAGHKRGIGYREDLDQRRATTSSLHQP